MVMGKAFLVVVTSLALMMLPAFAAGSISLMGSGSAGVSSALPTVSFVASAVDATPGTTHTLSGVSTGSAAGRVVIGVVECTRIAAGASISGVTIDANPMASTISNGTNHAAVAIFTLPYTTGASSTFVVTTSQSTEECQIATFAAYNLLSTTPDATNSAGGNATQNIGVATAVNGIAVGGAALQPTASPQAWTGALTNDFNTATAASVFAAGHNPSTSGTSNTMQYVYPGSGFAGSALASFH